LFPTVKIRRIGQHGNQKYHYQGIDFKVEGDKGLPLSEQEAHFFLAKLKTSITTLRHCPKGARIQVATALTTLIKDCVNCNTTTAWYRLLIFPYVVLHVSPKETNQFRSLTSKIKSNVDTWNQIDKCIIPVSSCPKMIRKSFPKSNEEMIVKKAEAKLADGDIKGAIRLLCSDDSVSDPNEATLQSLISKHPSHPVPVNFPDEHKNLNHTPLITTEEDVKLAIFSFPNGSAGGLDSLRPQIFKDLLGKSCGQAGHNLLSAITSLCNMMLSGDVPEPICPLLYGASLTALNKKDGGVRPIAVGNVYRRLVSKIACSKVADKLVEKFQPHQLGFGIRSGAEAGGHTARRFFNFNHTELTVFLKVDFLNAFNMVRRDRVLSEVNDHVPELYSYLHQCYRHHSYLFYQENLIFSQRGVQQGDPLGPALFSLVIQPIVNSMKSDLNLWYLDDGSLGGNPSTVLSDFQRIIATSEQQGLLLNFSKCEIGLLGPFSNLDEEAILRDFSKVAPGIRLIDEKDAFLLGVPLTLEAIGRCLGSKTANLKKFAERVSKMSPHSAYFLLKNSLAIPRLVFFLRCSPTWKCSDFLEDYDNTLKSIFENITNVSLTD
jgi:hypothetical protein